MLKAVVAALTIFAATTGFSRNTELDCLARNVYHEARGASELDQRAVAHVTVNRTQVRGFPNTVCGVVNAPGAFTWVPRRPPIRELAAWRTSIQVSEAALSPNSSDPTRGATYFWNSRLSPRWARSFTVTLRTTHHAYAKGT